MVNLIFITALTIQITPEVPDDAVFDTVYKQLKRDEDRLYELKESLEVALKEEAEVYLTLTLYYASVHHKQQQMYNATPETTQHNYKKDFKSLE